MKRKIIRIVFHNIAQRWDQDVANQSINHENVYKWQKLKKNPWHQDMLKDSKMENNACRNTKNKQQITCVTQDITFELSVCTFNFVRSWDLVTNEKMPTLMHLHNGFASLGSATQKRTELLKSEHRSEHDKCIL